MYKDILVHIPSTQSPEPVATYAVSLAKTLGARLEAVAFGYEPYAGPLSPEGATADVAALMDTLRQQALDDAKAALAIFAAQADKAGVPHNERSIGVTPGEAAGRIGELSRLYELTIVPQPDRSNPGYDQLGPESVLFNSGGPMLVIPFIQKGPFKADNVLICWDGQRESARAVRDAMPFLQRAGAVQILTINEQQLDLEEAGSRALAARLEQRGIRVKVQTINEAGLDAFNVMLSTAADYNAELMVMGGYGHSRLREFVLGGVTRGIFETMTLPVFMSH